MSESTRKLARGIQKGLEEAGAEIAHFKMSLRVLPGSAVRHGGSVAGASSGGAAGTDGAPGAGLAVVNVVANGRPAELSRKLPALLSGAAELLINVRAEAAPELIEAVVAREVTKAGRTLAVKWIDQAAFRPGMPKPVHRVTSVAGASSPKAQQRKTRGLEARATAVTNLKS